MSALTEGLARLTRGLANWNSPAGKEVADYIEGMAEATFDNIVVTPAARSADFDADDTTTWADIIIRNPIDAINSAAGIKFIIDATDSTAAGAGIAAIKRASTSHQYDLVFIVDGNGTFPVVAMRLTDTGALALGTETPNASALLDMVSTTRGFGPPSMTTTQKNAIATPRAGLMVYDSTLGKLCVRGASAWETITSS